MNEIAFGVMPKIRPACRSSLRILSASDDTRRYMISVAMLSLVEVTIKVLIRDIIWTVKSQAPSSYNSSLDTSICGLELDF